MPIRRLDLRDNPPIPGRVPGDGHRRDLLADADREVWEDAGASGGGFEELVTLGVAVQLETRQGGMSEEGGDVGGYRGSWARDRDVKAFGGEADFSG